MERKEGLSRKEDRGGRREEQISGGTWGMPTQHTLPFAPSLFPSWLTAALLMVGLWWCTLSTSVLLASISTWCRDLGRDVATKS